MTKRRELIAIGIILSFTGCKLTEEPHRGTDTTWVPSSEGFSLTAHATLNLALVEEQVNKAIPQLLDRIDSKIEKCLTSTKVLQFYDVYKTKWASTCLASVTVHATGPVERNGRIRVSGNGQDLRIVFPVKASAKLKPSGDISKATGLQETAETALTVVVTARPSLKPDWAPEVAASADFRWDKPPQIEVLGIPITFADKAEGPIRRQLAALLSRLPTVLSSEQVRASVAKSWNAAQVPIQVMKDPVVWVSVEPSTVSFSGVNIQSGILRAAFNVSGTGRLTVGAKPVQAKAIPLPALQVGNALPEESRLTVPIILSYSAIANQARKALLGTKFQIGDANVDPKLKGSVFQLTAIDAFPSDQSIALEAKVQVDVPGRFFDVKGSLFLLVKPHVVHARREVQLDRLEITSVTDTAFLDGASIALLKTGILNTIRPLLVYNYASDFDAAVKKATTALNFKPAAGFALQTDIVEVTVENAIVAKQGLVLPARIALRSEITAGL